MKRLRAPSLSVIRSAPIAYRHRWLVPVVLAAVLAVLIVVTSIRAIRGGQAPQAPVYGTVCYGGPCK